MKYIGRFAPSPTGQLHFGSLLAAVCSYIDAKHRHGYWHLRIDDLDKPREVTGSAEAMIASLQAHGMQWDGPIVYQSLRTEHYRKALHQLEIQQCCYRCYCSRSRLGSAPYDGHCRHRHNSHASTANYAIRIKCPSSPIRFNDKWQGPTEENITECHGDFVIWRKDNICAYQLAVVIDDHAIGANHIIRGNDLIDSTARQLHLYNSLKFPAPSYGHFPVLMNGAHQKLSKQSHAPAIENNCASTNLRRILECLGQRSAPMTLTSPADILSFATKHWQASAVPSSNIIWPSTPNISS